MYNISKQNLPLNDFNNMPKSALLYHLCINNINRDGGAILYYRW